MKDETVAEQTTAIARILCIEDEAGMLDLLRLILEAAGYSFIGAQDGADWAVTSEVTLTTPTYRTRHLPLVRCFHRSGLCRARAMLSPPGLRGSRRYGRKLPA